MDGDPAPPVVLVTVEESSSDEHAGSRSAVASAAADRARARGRRSRWVFTVVVWLRWVAVVLGRNAPSSRSSEHHAPTGPRAPRQTPFTATFWLVEVGLLGQLAVTGAGSTPSSRQERAVLAILAWRAPHPVSPEALSRGVWGDSAPPSAPKTLQALISRLRHCLPDGAINRGPGGYALVVDPDSVDAHRFVRLAAEGRADLLAKETERSKAVLVNALDLWRGDPFGDVDPDWAQPEIAWLEETRRAVVEDLLEARLADDPGSVVADADAAVQEEPLRERRWTILLDALRASGQRAEALRAFQRARLALDQVGMAPGPQLRDAERRAMGASDRDGATIAAPHASVPRVRNAFIGRAHECALAADRLEAYAVVTLVGPAGVGKSRVASEVLRTLGDDPEANSVIWVDLASGGSFRTVLAAIGDALEAHDPTSDPFGEVLSVLRQAPVVLALDDCEQVIDQVADVATRLTDACPDLRILATSREPLGIAGEALVAVRPLSLALDGSGHLPPALALFLDRVRLVDPDLQLSDADSTLALKVCAELDGLPLAIELAAALVPIVGVEELSRRLDDRLALLRSPRLADPRHGSLEGSLRASWDTLDPKLRRTLDTMSVFRSSFGLAAIQHVTGRPGADVLADVVELVRRSLVAVVQRHPEPRYRLLSSIRVFAAADLPAVADPAAIEKLHSDWTLRLADEATVGLMGPDQAGWLDRLENERHDLTATLDRCLTEPGAAERALPATMGLFNFWLARGPHREDGIRWCVGLAEAATGAPPLLRVQALLAAIMIATNLSPRRATPVAERAVELAGEDPDALAVAELAQLWSAGARAPRPSLPAEIEALRPRLPMGPAWWFGRLAEIYAIGSNGDAARAYEEGRQAAAELGEAGDRHMAAGFLSQYVDYGIAADDPRALEDSYHCLEVAHLYSCPSCESVALLRLAMLGETVDGQEPRALLGTAAGTAHAIGGAPTVVTCGTLAVWMLAQAGEHERALRLDGGIDRALDELGFWILGPACRMRRDEGVAMATASVGRGSAALFRREGSAISYNELAQLIIGGPRGSLEARDGSG